MARVDSEGCPQKRAHVMKGVNRVRPRWEAGKGLSWGRGRSWRAKEDTRMWEVLTEANWSWQGVQG